MSKQQTYKMHYDASEIGDDIEEYIDIAEEHYRKTLEDRSLTLLNQLNLATKKHRMVIYLSLGLLVLGSRLP